MVLNELRDRAYKTACEHGFHDTELSDEHFLCLVISELMEAVEAHRKGRLGKNCKSRFGMDYNRYPALVEEEKLFKCSFEKNVKDSLPDELADAFIRLLDLAGMRDISLDIAMKDIDNCIDDMAEACKDKIFTESIYAISVLPERYKGLYNLTTTVNDMLLSIFGLAKHLNIDLMWHIEQKMKYNELRPMLNGKTY